MECARPAQAGDDRVEDPVPGVEPRRGSRTSGSCAPGRPSPASGTRAGCAPTAGVGLLEDRLGARHRRDVLDPVGHHRRHARLVVVVHPRHRAQRVPRVHRDHHVVRPVHDALLGHHELELGVAGGVGLEDVARPGLADPGVAALERVDVALVVVALDEPALLAQDAGRLLPVGRGRGGRVDAEVEQAGGAEVGVVAHHPDPAAERRVPQVVDTRDLAADAVGVVGDPGEAGLPRDREAVARVVVRVLRDRRRVCWRSSAASSGRAARASRCRSAGSSASRSSSTIRS